MEAKSGLMLAMLLSGVMELLARFPVTVLKLMWRAGPPSKWVNAHVFARPVAAIIAVFFISPTRRLNAPPINGRR
jgi:uncharacterized iron-regulated membrane protein